jgi:hypothetical protein
MQRRELHRQRAPSTLSELQKFGCFAIGRFVFRGGFRGPSRFGAEAAVSGSGGDVDAAALAGGEGAAEGSAAAAVAVPAGVVAFALG